MLSSDNSCYVDALVKLRNSKTVTQEPAYWMLPSGIQKVEYAAVKDINFKSATPVGTRGFKSRNFIDDFLDEDSNIINLETFNRKFNIGMPFTLFYSITVKIRTLIGQNDVKNCIDHLFLHIFILL